MCLIKRLFVALTAKSPSIAYHLSFDVTRQIGESTVTIPIVRGMGLEHVHGTTEEGVRKVIDHVLRRTKGTFVDVGANIGQTLIKVAACDRDRRYLGFELQPSCIGYLAHLIEVNELPNFHLFPIGLFSERRLAILSRGAEADPGASVVPDLRAKSYVSSYPVILDTGDEIFRLLDEEAIAVIKIDVEGAELDVLRGMAATLARYEPILILEILPTKHLSSDQSLSRHRQSDLVLRRKETINGIKDLTKAMRYESFRILPAGQLEPNTNFEMSVYDHDCVNYLFATPRRLASLPEILASSSS